MNIFLTALKANNGKALKANFGKIQTLANDAVNNCSILRKMCGESAHILAIYEPISLVIRLTIKICP